MPGNFLKLLSASSTTRLFYAAVLIILTSFVVAISFVLKRRRRNAVRFTIGYEREELDSGIACGVLLVPFLFCSQVIKLDSSVLSDHAVLFWLSSLCSLSCCIRFVLSIFFGNSRYAGAIKKVASVVLVVVFTFVARILFPGEDLLVFGVALVLGVLFFELYFYLGLYRIRSSYTIGECMILSQLLATMSVQLLFSLLSPTTIALQKRLALEGGEGTSQVMNVHGALRSIIIGIIFFALGFNYFRNGFFFTRRRRKTEEDDKDRSSQSNNHDLIFVSWMVLCFSLALSMPFLLTTTKATTHTLAQPITNKFMLWWIFAYTFSDWKHVTLAAYWAAILLVSLSFIYLFTRRKTPTTTTTATTTSVTDKAFTITATPRKKSVPELLRQSANRAVKEKFAKLNRILYRKFFHVLVIIMFIPGTSFRPHFMSLCYAVALGLMLMVECIRVFKIQLNMDLARHIQEFLTRFTDARDSGTLILTHIYLLLGCAMPLWITELELEESATIMTSAMTSRPVSSLLAKDASAIKSLDVILGVLVLGVGDSLASICGVYFGGPRWPSSFLSFIAGGSDNSGNNDININASRSRSRNRASKRKSSGTKTLSGTFFGFLGTFLVGLLLVHLGFFNHSNHINHRNGTAGDTTTGILKEEDFGVGGFAAATLLVCLFEAFTAQIDNLVLPLYYLAMVRVLCY